MEQVIPDEITVMEEPNGSCRITVVGGGAVAEAKYEKFWMPGKAVLFKRKE